MFIQADERFATGLTELGIGQFGITLCSHRVNMLAQQRIGRYELASPQGVPKTLTTDGTYTYEYDGEGIRTRRFVDENQNQAFDAGDTDITDYEWDHRNRLVTVSKSSVYGGSITEQIDFAYDAFDRAISKTVDPDGAGGQTAETEFFIYDARRAVLTLEPDGDVTGRSLWADAVDLLLAEEDALGETYFHLPDHLGSTRDVADSNGDLVNHLVFDSFGNILSQTNPSDEYTIFYAALVWDGDVKLYRSFTRYYDATIASWTSEDPIGFAGGDANLSRYTWNAPTDAGDPSGLAKATKWYNGIKILVDADTAEFVLENGRRIKIRNAKFTGCDVSLSDLEELTDVSPDTINRLRKNFGDDLSVSFDDFGQPDFSSYVKVSVAIPDPGASNYGELAWNQLKEDNVDLYNALSPARDNYNWHHAPDGSLQLVDKDLHSAFQHTGLKSILSALGASACVLVPGLQSLTEGRVSDAGREFVYDVSPLGWGQWITDYFSWLYDSAYEDIYGRKPGETDDGR